LHFTGKSGCYELPFFLPSKPGAESASGDCASSADQGTDYCLKNGRPQSVPTSLGKNQSGRSPGYAKRGCRYRQGHNTPRPLNQNACAAILVRSILRVSA
jgi:hypothetical protein